MVLAGTVTLSGRFRTDTVICARTPLTVVIVIVALPTETAVTRPFSSTVTTDGFRDA